MRNAFATYRNLYLLWSNDERVLYDFFMTSLNDSLNSLDIFENILICISQLIKTTSNQLQLINYKYKDLHDNINSIYKNFNGGNRLKFKLLDLCEYISKLI